MKQRKMPLRKCTGCGEMKEKRELIRVVKACLLYTSPSPRDA